MGEGGLLLPGRVGEGVARLAGCREAGVIDGRRGLLEVGLVAGRAGALGDGREVVVDVAAGAGGREVSPGQREDRAVLGEGPLLPGGIGELVAGVASRREGRRDVRGVLGGLVVGLMAG